VPELVTKTEGSFAKCSEYNPLGVAGVLLVRAGSTGSESRAATVNTNRSAEMKEVEMCLQTNAFRMMIDARAKRQAGMLLCGILIAAATCSAQTSSQVPPSDLVAHVDFINSAPINQVGSSFPGEVSFRGSALPAEVNQPESSSFALPDAPGAMMQSSALQDARHVAPIGTRYIPAGWEAQSQTVHDKQMMALRDIFSPFSLMGYMAAASYSHLANGQPNYGVNSEAFGKRVGAAVVRGASEEVFTEMVFAPALHEDMRYYVQGRQHKLLHRVAYAITRPLIARTDSGHDTINGAELLGYASASALSYSYYPAINQNFHDTAATFGDGLLGSAFGNLVREFSGDLLIAVHIKKEE